ncbi:DUF4037 domain-containing protein [Demequina sp.]|uniref:DUF4037 domain-containing protein n=1 Tax=Demequina sp. TaxID=2050685 RepID=UPI003A871238
MDAHARVDVAQVLSHLDRLQADGAGPDAVRAVLTDAIARAQAAGDAPALLTLHNEAAGFHRSISEHDHALESADAALALIAQLGLAGSEAEATTLINVATAQRAAGRTADARATYARALAVGEALWDPADRRRAALHNNLSLALADAGEYAAALAEQRAAIAVLERASVDPERDIDIAMTHVNLATTASMAGDADAQEMHAERAVTIFAAAGSDDDPHAAAAQVAYAEVLLARGRVADAVAALEGALAVVGRAYGEGSEAYRITADNLEVARAAARTANRPAADTQAQAASDADAPARRGAERFAVRGGARVAGVAREPHVPGLVLARHLWEQQVRPMLAERYPEHVARIAAGLVGHGSEAYGFDDALSADHDFGVGLCLWLTAQDHAEVGEALQRDYEQLLAGAPGARPALAAHGQRRHGVFEVGEFFTSITGMPRAPRADQPHLWLALDEPTLAAATNGEVFADPLGAFGGARGSFQRMPEDVRLTHLSRRLGMMAQAGQYNVPRMLERGDGEAAFLAVGEFVRAAASAVFLLNRPAVAGYLPYYKWQFAALRRLAAKPLARLPQVHGELTAVMRVASAACLGGEPFGEGGKGAGPAAQALADRIEAVCGAVADELRAQGLSEQSSGFLEHHRPELSARIGDAWLRQQ